MAKPFQTQGIGQISITVHDVDRAVAFYRDSLNLKLLFSMSNMAFFECGGIQLMLGIPENPAFDHPSSTIYFNVENIDVSYEALLEKDVAFQGKPHKVADMGAYELWMAFFKDPDQNVHAIQSRVPKK